VTIRAIIEFLRVFWASLILSLLPALVAIQRSPKTIPKTERATAIIAMKLITSTSIPYGDIATVLAAEGTAQSTRSEKDEFCSSGSVLPVGQAASAFFENKPAVKSRLVRGNIDLILVKSQFFI